MSRFKFLIAVTKEKGAKQVRSFVADKCINFKKRDNLQNVIKLLTSRLICDIIVLKKYGGFKMRNLVTKEYRDLISKKLFLEREIDKLPIGYISKKTIKGRVQFYLQRREGNKVTSIYIKFEDVDSVSEGIDKRKKFIEELSLLDDRLKQLEQAAILIDRDLYCQLLLYKLSYRMDDLETTERHVCSSFGSAMNAIEGVAISIETHNEIEKWKRGDKSFLTIFEDTLRRYGFPVEVR